MSDKFSAFVIKALVDTITGGAGTQHMPSSPRCLASSVRGRWTIQTWSRSSTATPET